jgi:hypothetical protein
VEKQTKYALVAVGGAVALFLLYRVAKAGGTVQILDIGQRPSAKKALSSGAPADALPPVATVGVGAAPIYTPAWYHPSDDLSGTAVATAREMTIRQLQTAFNLLGASLKVDGLWALPVRQAIWDWQYLHTNDNPYVPLNVTGEIDQLTQDSIQAAVGKKLGIQTGFY